MRPWTVHEVQVLKAYAPMGATVVAAILERTPKAVRHVAELNGISIKDTGEDVATNAAALNLVERLRETPGLSICPMCGQRFARMRSTGMCRRCHLEQLLELHRDQLAEEIALRKLDKARQDKRRLRVCERCGRPFFPRPSSTSTICGECA